MLHPRSFLCFFLLLQSSISAPVSDSESFDSDSVSSEADSVSSEQFNEVVNLVGGFVIGKILPPVGAAQILANLAISEDERFEKKQNDLQAAVTAEKLISAGALCLGTIIAGACTVAGATMGPAGAVGGAVLGAKISALGAKIGGGIAGAGVLGIGAGHAAQHALDTIAEQKED
jgi:hypothetical protein